MTFLVSAILLLTKSRRHFIIAFVVRAHRNDVSGVARLCNFCAAFKSVRNFHIFSKDLAHRLLARNRKLHRAEFVKEKIGSLCIT